MSNDRINYLSKKSDLFESVAAFFIYCLAIPIAILWKAYVLSVLWGWFVVPLGVPPISIAWAYGLSCIVGLFWYNALSSDSTETGLAKAFSGLLKVILVPLLALFFGWIAYGFMP